MKARAVIQEFMVRLASRPEMWVFRVFMMEIWRYTRLLE